MTDDRKLAFVRLVDNCSHLVHRHLILIDQLDHIDACFSQRAHFRARIVGAADTPANVISAGIRFVLDKRS